jgi:hypothetical protein
MEAFTERQRKHKMLVGGYDDRNQEHFARITVATVDAPNLY